MNRKYLPFLFSCVIFSTSCFAQSSSPSILVAEKIAQKMQDSLSISPAQRDSIVLINLKIHSIKSAARLSYQDIDSLTLRFQQIERMRDSLYFPILGNEKYMLYRSKKGGIVNNN